MQGQSVRSFRQVIAETLPFCPMQSNSASVGSVQEKKKASAQCNQTPPASAASRKKTRLPLCARCATVARARQFSSSLLIPVSPVASLRRAQGAVPNCFTGSPYATVAQARSLFVAVHVFFTRQSVPMFETLRFCTSPHVSVAPGVAPRAPFPTLFHEQSQTTGDGGVAQIVRGSNDFGPALSRQAHLAYMFCVANYHDHKLNGVGSVAIRQACSPQTSSWDAHISCVAFVHFGMAPAEMEHWSSRMTVFGPSPPSSKMSLRTIYQLENQQSRMAIPEMENWSSRMTILGLPPQPSKTSLKTHIF